MTTEEDQGKVIALRPNDPDLRPRVSLPEGVVFGRRVTPSAPGKIPPGCIDIRTRARLELNTRMLYGVSVLVLSPNEFEQGSRGAVHWATTLQAFVTYLTHANAKFEEKRSGPLLSLQQGLKEVLLFPEERADVVPVWTPGILELPKGVRIEVSAMRGVEVIISHPYLERESRGAIHWGIALYTFAHLLAELGISHRVEGRRIYTDSMGVLQIPETLWITLKKKRV